ncbi:MAG: ThuA domain-containing protein [Christensenellales bacterium]|jgi:trehalose utilization protein
MIQVTIWNEFIHEKQDPACRAIYPNGIHNAIADFLGMDESIAVRTATLEEPENGLTRELLDTTDVLIWWGHMAHEKVSDEIAARVVARVNAGMGFIALHSAHASKPFRLLMGTPSGMLRWREDGEKARLWVMSPGHPIVKGIGDYFEVPHDETYGERFHIPDPDELIFVSWYPGGEIFRSGCCFRRGGRIFYFQPGHETFPVYHQKEIQTVITNAVHWAAPYKPVHTFVTNHVQRIEP